MQRLFLLLAALVLGLYGIPAAPANGHRPALKASWSHVQLAQVAADTAGDLTPGPWRAVAHVALLLPLKSADFANAAEMVRQGFLVAAESGGRPPFPIRVYATQADTASILTAYEDAIRNGAAVVVGPLTRDGVGTLAASGRVSVPTLALNTIDAPAATLPRELYLFGLSVEGEARQIARLAFTPERPRAFVISSDTALARRLHEAFVRAWIATGGSVAGEFFPLDGGPEAWTALRRHASAPDAIVFLALEHDKARLIRPYLNPAMPVFATSLVYAGADDPVGNFDLNGVRFVDMPWLLTPDHPAVMIYPRPALPVSADLERLYALGIDAYRLSLEIARLPAPGTVHLDGVCGDLRLNEDRQFERTLVPAQFAGGQVRVLRRLP